MGDSCTLYGEPGASNWEVIVGNIGTVYTGYDRASAKAAYIEYRSQSRQHYGRASGEPVILMKDGEIHWEWEGCEAPHTRLTVKGLVLMFDRVTAAPQEKEVMDMLGVLNEAIDGLNGEPVLIWLMDPKDLRIEEVERTEEDQGG